MAYTKVDKIRAIHFFMGKIIFPNPQTIEWLMYDGQDDKVIGIVCPDTNARLIDITVFNHIRYINNVIKRNFIRMRNMTGYYERQRTRTERQKQVREREKIVAEREEKEYVEYIRECEFKSYDVDETEECPICYNHYGEQEDGTFLCKDGTSNSSRYKKKCNHHCCVKCIKKMAEADRDYFQGKCPLCRESWAGWLQLNYNPPAIISCFDNAIGVF